MAQHSCPSCDKVLEDHYRFCPKCGIDLQAPIVCPDCSYPNENNSKFCQECGIPLKGNRARKASPAATACPSIDPPPRDGITIEFPYSSAQSFPFALAEAQKFSTFKQYGEEKKAIYRITVAPSEIESTLELVEHLKGWRRRTVYVDGNREVWDSIFSFTYCYTRKRSCYRPELYCHGFEEGSEYNAWGCIHACMPFTEYARWFCWGSWVSNRGDWKFDKERIRFELQRALFQFRFCPSLNLQLIENVLNALPETVNPYTDSNWRFAEHWQGENVPGLLVTIQRFGYPEQIEAKGVCPNGPGALNELIKKIKKNNGSQN